MRKGPYFQNIQRKKHSKKITLSRVLNPHPLLQNHILAGVVDFSIAGHICSLRVVTKVNLLNDMLTATCICMPKVTPVDAYTASIILKYLHFTIKFAAPCL